MGIAPHIARLRASVGHDLLLLPSAAVLPIDDQERVLLVRQRDSGLWGTVGGAIDVDESPPDAARREAREEIGVEVELTGLLGALGGPRFHLTYPNGDRAAYVSVVYRARIVSGEPAPDDDETTEVRWFTRDELSTDPDVHPFAHATFESLGWIG